MDAFAFLSCFDFGIKSVAANHDDDRSVCTNMGRYPHHPKKE